MEQGINLLDVTMCISDAVDLVDRAINNHHRQVAYIAYCIGDTLGLSKEEQSKLLLAGAVHDIGALSLKERLDSLHFELRCPHEHADSGYRLLKMFQPFSEVAEIVRMHHVPWNNGEGVEFNGLRVPIGSHILHLADRIAVSIEKDEEILAQTERICNKIRERSGKMFMPEAVDAFMELARKESFWFDVTLKISESILPSDTSLPTKTITLDVAQSLAELFAHIIDFRSRFTATHSSGIAASAEELARLAGYSLNERKMMRIAGYLHDLGKLAVPAKILEKPALLTKDEFRVIKRHPYLTYRILKTVKGFETINTWAALHHERLDGKGYPFHLKGESFPEGSRIMAVADVFTAITENRPYREGMPEKRALQILQKMVANSALDNNIVSILFDHFDEINHIRVNAQESALRKYQKFEGTMMKCA
ncbi:MAG: HD domain-containing protein [Firmicutes bacterium]|nr:HD domain-containing protein [Bacillota bacterium]